MLTLIPNVDVYDSDEGQCEGCKTFTTVHTAVIYPFWSPGEPVERCERCLGDLVAA